MSYTTKKELQEQLKKIIDPLVPLLKKQPLGRIKLGSHGTVYPSDIEEIEAFLRPLWGLAPAFSNNLNEALFSEYLIGIVAGTDPLHEDYWGEIQDYHQLIVEMAALCLFLLLNKERVLSKLAEPEKENLFQWLSTVNHYRLPKNNWRFFRILVNSTLKNYEMPYAQQQIEEDFAMIDGMYCGNGWYYDGKETQRDYYVSFAIHFYSLIYTRVMSEDVERFALIKERASTFAHTFKYWFDARGEALPFGRSLTYRFAQVAFFSALVFANVEALPWGEIKGIISRHLENWFQKEIFSADGFLSVGYHYENLVFSEGYNGYGSPYWALKSFILLAVPDEHPYWQAQLLPLIIENRCLAVPESRNVYQYNPTLTHLQAFPAGQFVHYQSHSPAKYSKFVYSTVFGFSVPKADYWYYEGAYDSTLALSEDEHSFRVKGETAKFQISEDRIIHEWTPWKDTHIRSTVIPLETCHVRIHEITTNKNLLAYEGGFSVPMDEVKYQITGLAAHIQSKIGASFIEGLYGFNQTKIVKTEPNTNLFYQRTLLPHTIANLVPGRNLLVSVISGTLPNENLIRPEIVKSQNKLIISQKEKKIEICFSV